MFVGGGTDRDFGIQRQIERQTPGNHGDRALMLTQSMNFHLFNLSVDDITASSLVARGHTEM